MKAKKLKRYQRGGSISVVPRFDIGGVNGPGPVDRFGVPISNLGDMRAKGDNTNVIMQSQMGPAKLLTTPVPQFQQQQSADNNTHLLAHNASEDYRKLVASGMDSHAALIQSRPGISRLKTSQAAIDDQTNLEFRTQNSQGYDPSKLMDSQTYLAGINGLDQKLVRGANMMMNTSTGNPVTDFVKNAFYAPGKSFTNMASDPYNSYVKPGMLRGSLNLMIDAIGVAPTLMTELGLNGQQVISDGMNTANNLLSKIAAPEDFGNLYKNVKDRFSTSSIPTITPYEQRVISTTRNIGSRINSADFHSSDVPTQTNVLKGILKQANGLSSESFENLTGFPKSEIQTRIDGLQNTLANNKKINQPIPQYGPVHTPVIDNDPLGIGRPYDGTIRNSDSEAYMEYHTDRQAYLEDDSQAGQNFIDSLLARMPSNTFTEPRVLHTLNNYDQYGALIPPEPQQTLLKKFNDRISKNIPQTPLNDPQELLSSLFARANTNPAKSMLNAYRSVEAAPKGENFIAAHSLSSDSYPASLGLIQKGLNDGIMDVNFHGYHHMNALGFSEKAGLPASGNLNEINQRISQMNMGLKQKIPYATMDNNHIQYPNLSVTRKKEGGSVTNTGYLPNSPDRFNDYNIIPSSNITMRNVQFPIHGTDNLGNQQMMYPGQNYTFPGSQVLELPMKQFGGNPMDTNEQFQINGAGRNKFKNNVFNMFSGNPAPYNPFNGLKNSLDQSAYSNMYQGDNKQFQADTKSGNLPVYSRDINTGEQGYYNHGVMTPGLFATGGETGLEYDPTKGYIGQNVPAYQAPFFTSPPEQSQANPFTQLPYGPTADKTNTDAQIQTHLDNQTNQIKNIGNFTGGSLKPIAPKPDMSALSKFMKTNAADVMNAGLSLTANTLQNNQDKTNERNRATVLGGSDNLYDSSAGNRGDYTANEGYFKPDQDVATQFGAMPYINRGVPTARYGGTPQFQKGGLFDTNKTGYSDSVLNAHSDLDWVKRLYDKNPESIQIPGQPGRSTHFMGDDGNGYVFPTVVNMKGSLKYMGDDAEDYAHKTNTGIQLPKDQGTWFADNGYKQGTNVLKNFQKGTVLRYGGALPKASLGADLSQTAIADISAGIGPGVTEMAVPTFTMPNYSFPTATANMNPILPPATPTPSNKSGDVATRTNNPGNMIYHSWMDSLGAVDSGIKAQDSNGHFATFPSIQAGLKAREMQLFGMVDGTKHSDIYLPNTSVDSALRSWSGHSYGAEIYPELKGKTLAEVTPAERAELTKRQVKRESGQLYHKLQDEGIFKEGGEYNMTLEQVQHLRNSGYQIDHI